MSEHSWDIQNASLVAVESARLQLEKHMLLANREFPSSERARAYRTYINWYRIQPDFFLNDGGERCIWGPDIDYYWSSKSRGEAFKEVIEKNEYQERKYLLTSESQTLSTIDQPKLRDKTILVVHPSESGWNLPVSHSRHILKLPQEILLLILGHVLASPKSRLLPLVAACNLERWFRQPHFEERGSRRERVESEDSAPEVVDDPCGLPTLAWIRHKDENGQYTEMRYINRKLIDASCLRACQSFFDIGQRILYNMNSFEFGMTNTDWNSCPPSRIGDEVGYHRPCPAKPEFNNEWLDAVDEGILAIEAQIQLLVLPGWLYYDKFLRFLYTIGTKNAALIKSLTFRGVINIHQCEYERCGLRCADDLLDSLQLYFPFIKKFCPELKKLTIYAEQDRTIRNVSVSALFPLAPRQLNKTELNLRDELLSHFLEKHIEYFSTLEELEVVDISKGENKRTTLEVACGTVSWVKEKADQRARAASPISQPCQDNQEG
ncbi:uncharacterized protein PAC_13948 [Phialocephala subalpina]|uniref:Uncharacterized protein n=1 Tax=Phialocephala subalpina TaxID=576137 RepID=A0A1L7XG87_9HELO|nr:uncharacterized protein PAC_13948 [Phialocephala subalpina]